MLNRLGGDLWQGIVSVKDASFSVPNDPSEGASNNSRASYDHHKTVNCSPHFHNQFRSWGQADAANKKLSAQTFAAGVYRVNEDKQQIGCPFVRDHDLLGASASGFDPAVTGGCAPVVRAVAADSADLNECIGAVTAARPTVNVRISAFGLRYANGAMGMDLPDSVSKTLGLHAEALVAKAWEPRALPGSDVVAIDGRFFMDPDAVNSGAARHIGTYPPTLTGIVKKTHLLKPLLARVRRAVQVAASRGRDLDLLVFCRSGRHRSVAIAAVLHYAWFSAVLFWRGGGHNMNDMVSGPDM